MPAIETVHNGYKFRSRLEARWAVFFSQLDIQWLYEPEGFEWPGTGRYLPDFFLPKTCSRSKDWDGGTGVWVEVKPDDYVLITADSERYERLVIETGKPFLLVRGLPLPSDWSVAGGRQCDWDECRTYGDGGNAGWDSPMLLIRCHACGLTRFEFAEGNYMVCNDCGACADDRHEDLIMASDAAKQSRFTERAEGWAR